MIQKSELVLSTSPLPHVRLLSMNRPAKRNALSNELIAALASACRDAILDEDVRCIVLCGTDTFFCAGADIKEMQQRGFEAINNLARRNDWRDLTNCLKPIIAAVEGVCLGGGHELAMLADIIIAGEGALFGQPEINIGVLPGDGGTQRLTRVAGKSLAMLMILTGQSISARAAMQAGMVSEVTETGQARARALEIAEIIAQKPPRSTELAKAAVLAAYQTNLDAGVEFERQAIRVAFTTSDQQEGMDAFFEKRPPNYQGK
ncbi:MULTISPECIES: enoyl-CoA hydratase-related protein [Bradyrhizobium]|uniref:Enoyl-CoA hydratase-related protein n=4 Tax=Bradyrhizobium TaxID=374 RepID=A0A9X1UE22_9BRAD|nr:MULTISPECIES: enoyl-CoA hydratase-related protein [Bradyrhizobium]MCG2631964.1 enoyl-CoA hydratase-related protein [Bradyrhizobium zhengyangense]MCG2645019.1 enoyl-CoA hydratase-related protein [Bradyrhizobium zhengyangense]MCG2672757.1 enoyl-CoA hydratase-related protein [Bradyrhizobium zhengyangense]MDN4985392.1 enoyl-CoA hydratase-related protein [Bradyrhizobium sp. WYCCWR 13022]MDN5002377.1 enoyl-CoA hydratase-related protein [Bradyrhizobium sp. WYCCWR 12677]